MNTLPSTRSPLAALPSRLRWSPLPVVVALLAACGGDPPKACGSFPQQTLFVRQTALLQPCFEDPEGEKLTLSAKAADDQIATVIVLGGAIRIQALYPGNTTVTVTAEDPGGQTASMDIDVLVPNRAPVTRGRLRAIRMLVDGQNKRLIDEYFSDPDGQQLTFTASSADPAVATAEIVDSIRLLVTGISVGTSVVTVTATDPGGLSVSRDVNAEILDPVEIFADDFETGMDGWRPNFASGGFGSTMEIGGEQVGVIRWWNNYSYYFGIVEKTNINVTEFEFTLAAGVDNENIIVGPYTLNSGNPLVYWFAVGYSESNRWFGESTYRLLRCCGWQSEGQWQGESDEVNEYGEINETTMTLRNGELTGKVGSTVLITVDIAGRGWTLQAQTARLSTWPAGTSTRNQAFADWTEMWALPAADDVADWGPAEVEVPELVTPRPDLAIPIVEIRRR